METGLISKSDVVGSVFGWDEGVSNEYYGQCWGNSKTVFLNPFLDRKLVPEVFMDEVMYHEILHLRQNRAFSHFLSVGHDETFRNWICRFPDYRNVVGMKKWLGPHLDDAVEDCKCQYLMMQHPFSIDHGG